MLSSEHRPIDLKMRPWPQTVSQVTTRRTKRECYQEWYQFGHDPGLRSRIVSVGTRDSFTRETAVGEMYILHILCKYASGLGSATPPKLTKERQIKTIYTDTCHLLLTNSINGYRRPVVQLRRLQD